MNNSRRIAIGVAYNGALFKGWQSQSGNVATVQQALESALSTMLDQPISIVCAGRTDSGVHASGQVIHLDTDKERPEKAWRLGVNRYLSDHVSVLWHKTVPNDFHARFSALARRYRYVIFNSPIKPTSLIHQITWIQKKLNTVAMHQAAQYLLGEHDFSAYRAANCQSRTPMRCLYQLNVTQISQQFVVVDIIANAFLYKMVRNIVGVLIKIGLGEKDISWSRQVLAGRDRTLAATTAKPFGLYLVDVIYEEKYQLPEQTLGPFFINGSIAGNTDKFDKTLINSRPWQKTV